MAENLIGFLTLFNQSVPMLKFNSKGLLVPYSNISSSIEILETEFVTNIHSSVRKEIYRQYFAYSKTLKQLCNELEIVQWIDGSFVTRKPEPGDIDLVSFIDHSLVELNELKFKEFAYPASLNLYGVDAYIVKVYPKNHRNFAFYKSDQFYWLNQFNRTKTNRAGNRYPKGFLEINFLNLTR